MIDVMNACERPFHAPVATCAGSASAGPPAAPQASPVFSQPDPGFHVGRQKKDAPDISQDMIVLPVSCFGTCGDNEKRKMGRPLESRGSRDRGTPGIVLGRVDRIQRRD
jgi:hypothetical protein